ncbi:MAG: hypothetical protein RR839_04625 [Oscillospiraceae bacterium]
MSCKKQDKKGKETKVKQEGVMAAEQKVGGENEDKKRKNEKQ